jgi:hypothetical protein
MRHQQKTVAKRDWDGEFGNYDEWAKLGPQPPYRSAIFLDAKGRRCVTQHDFVRARDDRGSPSDVSEGERTTKASLGIGWSVSH